MLLCFFTHSTQRCKDPWLGCFHLAVQSQRRTVSEITKVYLEIWHAPHDRHHRHLVLPIHLQTASWKTCCHYHHVLHTPESAWNLQNSVPINHTITTLCQITDIIQTHSPSTKHNIITNHKHCLSGNAILTLNIYTLNIYTLNKTSGYATWFTAGGAIRIGHYDVIDDVITRKL